MAEDKPEFLGNARALLFPVQWPEPFGLVLIESLACGTPVIAWDHGSVPEIGDVGVSEFVVESEQEALEAIQRVSMRDRAVDDADSFFTHIPLADTV